MKREVKSVYIHFLDVGYGDCSFIRLPDGKVILIDCGTPQSVKKISSFLKNEDVSNIFILIVTHFHEDHTGGGAEIVSSFNVENIVVSIDYLAPDIKDPFHSYLSGFKDKLRIVNKGDVLLGEKGVLLKILSPFNIITERNENALDVFFRYGKTALLFHGEMSGGLEQKLVQTYRNELPIQLLRLGHHGWGTGNSEFFLETVSPEIVILSTGKSEYPSPDPKLIDYINSMGYRFFRTDWHGDIAFLSNGEEYSIRKTKPFSAEGIVKNIYDNE